MKGLLLGAGASFEVGMPLAYEFTNTFRSNILKRLDTKLFNIREGDPAREILIKSLLDKEKNYEDIIAHFERKCLDSKYYTPSLRGVLSQLIECAQSLLFEEQCLTKKILKLKLNDYYGFFKILESQGCLNIFSLNHDVVVEEVCDHYRIPYRDGFYKNNNNYKKIANFKTINHEMISAGKMNFFTASDFGVNLFKLHGAFDIFAVEDKKLFLKTSGSGDYIGSQIDEVKKVENENLRIMNINGIRTCNEITACDDDGQIQFLRRSLITGGYKYQNRFEQVVPIQLLEIFRDKLMDVSELIIIGYSFGDIHINECVKEWMRNGSRRIIIFDPFLEDVPHGFKNHKNKIEIVRGGFTDFSLSINSSKEDRNSKTLRDIITGIREKILELRIEHSSKDISNIEFKYKNLNH
ncbi:SIR2 family protein [Thalassospira marina]|uniref:Uncharacterized protein n=1 Tax=Thalassospira marina TaxID=2048283 RepID=A0A2N3KB00_9PROT|nr:SIR2 family protein [Thalassospira marina]PKR47727.1 hypothetical protein COO20_25625 [Thalassospira marina]